MSTNRLKRIMMCGVLLAFVGVVTGCGRTASDSGSPSESSRADQEGAAHAEATEHDHSGWWCVEHGLPEEECSMCSAKAAARFKESGDWCEDHHRAASQCFKCDPSLAEKPAKLYEAKFGHAPPAPTE